VGPKWKLDGQLVASIVVPTCGYGATLREGLEALLGQEVGGTYEILVVDNNPAPEMEVAVRSIAGGHPTRMLRYIHEPKPGLLTARHRGAAEARSPIVVYVDDDIIVRPRWLNALLDSMADPEVGIAGGPVRPRWEVAPPEWFSQFPESYLSLLDLGNSSRELAWPGGVYGCNMAVRRLALYESGGFNPDATSEKGFPWRRGDGETGLHQKVFDASYKVVYTPLAAVEHIIPGDRLTRQAFYRRGLMVGLSWSYAALRNSGRGYRFYLKTLLRIAGAKIRVIRCCAWGLL
jgi:GT2 family glycosyltransferase